MTGDGLFETISSKAAVFLRSLMGTQSGMMPPINILMNIIMSYIVLNNQIRVAHVLCSFSAYGTGRGGLKGASCGFANEGSVPFFVDVATEGVVPFLVGQGGCNS